MLDVIIIGSGPAGLSAAIYAMRAGLQTLVVEKQPMSGGQVLNTVDVDNYPGLPGIGGFELGMSFREHAQKLGAQFETAEVIAIESAAEKEKVVVTAKERYQCRAIVLAMGAAHRMLGVPGEEALRGMGVSYCATCDGAFFRDKTAAVVGGGDVALEDALYLAKGCKQVYLIHRRQELRAAKVLQEQVMAEGKITFIPDTVITEIKGNGKVEKAVLLNKKDGTASELPLDAVFIAVGMNPETDAVASVLTLDNGYVRAGEDGVTEQPGLFVAGDVRTKRLRQIVTAVSDGANAVTSITDYLAQR